MLTRLGVLMIGRAPQVVVFTLEITWCCGWAKSKIQSLYQQWKLNTLQQGVVVHNCYGWRSSYMTLESLKTLCVCVLWQHEWHKLVKKSSLTLKIEAYRDPIPLHLRLGRGEDYVSRVYQHWKLEGKHIY